MFEIGVNDQVWVRLLQMQIFAYKTVSQSILTPILLARRWYDLETITLKPGENWWLEDIITGGFNYPVAIAVVPVL